MTDDSKQHHLQLNKAMIQGAEYALVPGDPQRVEVLAKAFDPNAQFLESHREFTSYLADFHGHKVLVCSTGIGGPSTSIVVEELANIGIRYFLRVGTTGSIHPKIKLGDLVIVKAAVRLDGASTHYAPIEYPAVASLRFTASLLEAAEMLNVPHHVGIVSSTDTFYPGQERYDNYSKYVVRRFQGSMKEWQQLNVVAFEMESATLFTIANTFGLHAACMCGVVAERLSSEVLNQDSYQRLVPFWQQVAMKTIYLNMLKRGMVKDTSVVI
ncbi:MAG TPA: uridine phosphorylase [Coxiellaceae bacterium]|nr:uridine phosphorylase [Coxiellaceae bacterium]